MPGLYYCFKNLTSANIFIILYGTTSIYFAGVMVRLMLVLAPVACILGGIGLSGLLSSFIPNLDAAATTTTAAAPSKEKKDKKEDKSYPYKFEVAVVVVGALSLLMILFSFHATWATAEVQPTNLGFYYIFV